MDVKLLEKLHKAQLDLTMRASADMPKHRYLVLVLNFARIHFSYEFYVMHYNWEFLYVGFQAFQKKCAGVGGCRSALACIGFSCTVYCNRVLLYSTSFEESIRSSLLLLICRGIFPIFRKWKFDILLIIIVISNLMTTVLYYV